jgi:5-methylcytosine-specific restriction endonuclease McrA
MKSLAQLAKENGVAYKDCGGGHLQLTGVVLVNYYPDSRRCSAYIAGTVGAHHHVTHEQAIRLALKPTGLNIKTPRGNQKRAKMRLYRRSQKCRWCGKPLTLEEATVDHVIPLSKGGLDQDNNRVISCEPCNRDRRNDMPNSKYRQRKADDDGGNA